MKEFFITLLLKLVELFFKSSKSKVEEGSGKGETEKQLNEKLKKDGWK